MEVLRSKTCQKTSRHFKTFLRVQCAVCRKQTHNKRPFWNLAEITFRAVCLCLIWFELTKSLPGLWITIFVSLFLCLTSSYIYFQNFAMSCNGFAKIWFLKVQSLKLLDFLSFWRPRVHGLCKFVPDNAIIFRCQKVTFSKSCFLKPINYVHI